MGERVLSCDLPREHRTESASNVLRMTSTAAAFRLARICTSFSGENLQFLYWVLPSYRGFLIFAGALIVVAVSAAIQCGGTA
jgi:hypothetical protein